MRYAKDRRAQRKTDVNSVLPEPLLEARQHERTFDFINQATGDNPDWNPRQQVRRVTKEDGKVAGIFGAGSRSRPPRAQTEGPH